MKREAYRHPKMLDLTCRLGVDRARAIGIVTLLLDFTADMAPQGDVGKWPDGAIARACEWGTSPTDASLNASAFIAALVAAKWVDTHPSARLIVHDWPVHCERFVKSKLATLGLTFHPAYSSTSTDVSPDTSGDASCDPPRDLPNPTQSNPNQTNPPAKPKPSKDGGLVGGKDFGPWKEIADRLVRLGASRWKQSIQAAQQSGCSPEYALQLIEYAAIRGFGVGAIVRRLEIAHPEMGVEKGWPDRSEKLKQAATKRTAEDAAKAREAEATAIVRAGRTAKKSDEEILEILKAKGLTWPK